MQNKKEDLCSYRMKNAFETLQASKLCIDNGHELIIGKSKGMPLDFLANAR